MLKLFEQLSFSPCSFFDAFKLKYYAGPEAPPIATFLSMLLFIKEALLEFKRSFP
jgi:hypothetical protein